MKAKTFVIFPLVLFIKLICVVSMKDISACTDTFICNYNFNYLFIIVISECFMFALTNICIISSDYVSLQQMKKHV